MNHFRRWVVASFAVILVGAAGFVVHLVTANIPTRYLLSSGAKPSPSPSRSAKPKLVLKMGPQVYAGPLAMIRVPANPATVTVGGTEMLGWALVNLKTGTMTTSPDAAFQSSTAESMIKPWIAADYLRRTTNVSQQALSDLKSMIVANDDHIASQYYDMGGGNALMQRLVTVCGLSHVGSAKTGWWSFTTMSPKDAGLYAKCIADGKAAGPKYTPWLLAAMQHVTGGVNEQITSTSMGGRWGVIDGLPKPLSDEVAIKNGATQQGGGWHVNCMGIIPGQWAIAIMIQTMKDMPYGATACADITKQFVIIG